MLGGELGICWGLREKEKKIVKFHPFFGRVTAPAGTWGHPNTTPTSSEGSLGHRRWEQESLPMLSLYQHLIKT